MKILQTDKALDPWIQKYGCALMSLIHLGGLDLTADQVNAFHAQAGKAKAYNSEGNILWDAMCDLLHSEHGTRIGFADFATAKAMPRSGQGEMLWYWCSTHTPSHFVAGDGKGGLGYDPMGNPAVPKGWILKGKRFFDLDGAEA